MVNRTKTDLVFQAAEKLRGLCMNKLPKFTIAAVLSLFLFGCGGGGGGGDNSLVTPTLPSDATIFTAANATEIARSAVDTVVLTSALADFRQEEIKTSTSDVIKRVTDRVLGRYLPSRSVASRTETEPCDNQQGSITFNTEETATSATGSVTFDACNFAGSFIDGRISIAATFNDSTGDFSANLNGILTFTDNVQSATIAMNYGVTGNDFDGSFSTTMSISVSGVPDANFLLTTPVPISGISFDVLSGEILVEGANGTRLRITVTDPNVADVFLDDNGSGTFVFHSTINI
jgi:hypothetical protein